MGQRQAQGGGVKRGTCEESYCTWGHLAHFARGLASGVRADELEYSTRTVL